MENFENNYNFIDGLDDEIRAEAIELAGDKFDIEQGAKIGSDQKIGWDLALIDMSKLEQFKG